MDGAPGHLLARLTTLVLLFCAYRAGETSQHRKLLVLGTTKASLPVQPCPWFPNHDQYQGCTRNFGKACRRVGPALFLSRQATQDRPPWWPGKLNASLPTPGQSRLTFALVAASSFSSHAFSTVVSASMAFQFFSRRSCGDTTHTQRAISHTKLLAGTAEDFKATAEGTGFGQESVHKHSFLPVFPVAPHTPWLWQCPGWDRSSRSKLRMPAGDTGQEQGCKVASTQVTPPCRRGIRSRGAGRCEGASSEIALALPG